MLHAATNPRARQAARWGTRWCHLWADKTEDLPQLHEIARKIGLKRAYFQNRPGFPHYDLVPSKRKLALAAGAKEQDLREWLKKNDPKLRASKDGKLRWEDWKAEALRIAKEQLGWTEHALSTIPWETMKEHYYDDRDWPCTPLEAWEEEYSAAQ